MADKKERTKVVTPPFRVSFPAVFEAKSYDGGEAKFSTVAIFEPAKFSEADKKAWAAMHAIADESSRSMFKKPLKDLPANFKKPFRDGVEKAHLEGYGEGKVFMTLSSKQRPGLVDKDRQAIITQDEFYPGCWARATVTSYPYDNKGKGVAFGLHNLQKLGDDTNFSGRVAAEDDFEDDAGDVFQGAAAGELEKDDPLA